MRIRPGPRRSLLVLALAIPIGGCDDIGLLGAGADLDGTFELTRVNERALPYEIDTYTTTDGLACELDVIAGSIVLESERRSTQREEGEFELQLAYRETCRTRTGRTVVEYPLEREAGEYRVETGRVRFYPYNREYFEDFDASRSGSTLTLEIGSHRFRFEEDRSIG